MKGYTDVKEIMINLYLKGISNPSINSIDLESFHYPHENGESSKALYL